MPLTPMAVDRQGDVIATLEAIGKQRTADARGAEPLVNNWIPNSTQERDAAGEIADHAALDAGVAEYLAHQDGRQMGDPVKGVQVIIDMVESDTAPVRLMLGEDAYQLWEATVASRNRDLAVWRCAAGGARHRSDWRARQDSNLLPPA